MTVRELIVELLKHPAELPVYLGDWNECFADDMTFDESEVVVIDETKTRGEILPKRLRIGDGRRYR